MSNDDLPTIRPRRLVVGAAMALLVAALVIVSIGRLVGFSDLAETIAGASWQWLVLCATGQCCVFVGYSGVLRSSIGFEGGPVVERLRSGQITLASFALTQLVAFGGAAGLAFVYWSLRQLGMARRHAWVRLIGLNTMVYFVFATVAWVAALVAMVTGAAPAPMVLPWLAAVPLIVGLADYFTGPVRVTKWTEPDGGGARELLAVGVDAAWWVRRAIRDRDGRAAWWWAVAYWAGDLLSLWAALRAFGQAPPPAALIVAYASGYLVQAIPVPFIATGGVDAATVLTLTAVGVPAQVALPALVAHRVFAFWLPLGPGVWSAVGLIRDGAPTAPGSVRSLA
jgi:uncharacterized membrane protein YbhN (UPF0104 family)